ncbi:redoxin domain-containing protein [Haloarcula salina]|uniref:redoxin domain-containing protein n=1 Tax=Haloarcula salina TaxID=1429914 RepID=UPI003C704385
MLSEGTAAPEFELPALVDGSRKRVALSEYLGEDVVILAFYPADFNPACDDASCDLGELDLFTMQKDVTILGISPDSVYSHRAFAERYDLKVPLLADTDHEVAREYGVDFVDPIGQRLVERAVVVIDHDGEVQYAWSTDDLQELPRVEEIKDAIADTGGDDTAFARYRVGHAHYTEGRRSFTAAMGGFRDSEWVVAQGDFQQAREEFAAAEDHFDTAVRFVDDGSLSPIYEGAKAKANALWQASDWLTRAASAYSSGSGAEGQELRDDAECPLEDARGYREPPDPDEQWPPAVESLEKDEPAEDGSFLPTETEDVDTSLGVDIDDEVERADGDESAVDETEAPTASEPEPRPPGDQTEADGDDARASAASDGELTDVDETDIEEIQAELAASEAETRPTEPLDETPTAMVDAPPETVGADGPREDADAAGEPNQPAADDRPDQSDSGAEPAAEAEDEAGGPAELDLADPTAGDDEDGPTDAGPAGDDEADTDGGAVETGGGATAAERDEESEGERVKNAARADGEEPGADS